MTSAFNERLKVGRGARREEVNDAIFFVFANRPIANRPLPSPSLSPPSAVARQKEEKKPRNAPSSSISACSASSSASSSDLPGTDGSTGARLAGAEGIDAAEIPTAAGLAATGTGFAAISSSSASSASRSSASSSASSASNSSSSRSAAYPTGWPSASCTCRIFSLCSLMSSITLSTSSMLVSRCSCFIAPAPLFSALNVSAVVLLPSSVITCSSSFSWWFCRFSTCCSYSFFFFKHCNAARLFFNRLNSLAFVSSAAIFLCNNASRFSSMEMVCERKNKGFRASGS